MAYDPLLEINPQIASGRRAAGTNLAQQRAQIEYNKTGLRQGYEQQLGDLNRQFDAQRRRLPGSFAKRRLLNSGIYGQALQDYGENRSRTIGRAGQQYQHQSAGLDLQARQAEQSYAQALAEYAEQERAARERAELDGLLRMLFGG